MAEIALEVQNTAPQDPLLPAAATIDSSYSEALDSVCLFHYNAKQTMLTLRHRSGLLKPSLELQNR